MTVESEVFQCFASPEVRHGKVRIHAQFELPHLLIQELALQVGGTSLKVLNAFVGMSLQIGDPSPHSPTDNSLMDFEPLGKYLNSIPLPVMAFSQTP